MMAHTPGPWEVETVKTSIGICHKIGRFPSNGISEITHACIYVDGGRIGEIFNDVEKELFSNARLIAAAPDLLEALKSAIKTAEFERHPHRGWQDEARAAIAKAEGKE